jgi:hypothetical protein
MANQKVFISYARTSAGVPARALRDALASKGIDAFLDERVIPPGSQFPDELATALLDSHLVVVLADTGYFQRPWCVYEFQVAITPARTAGNRAHDLDFVIVGLEAGGGGAAVANQLPPELARRSWPDLSDTHALVTLATERLAGATLTLRERFSGLDDVAVQHLRQGGSVPAAETLSGIHASTRELPP